MTPRNLRWKLPLVAAALVLPLALAPPASGADVLGDLSDLVDEKGGCRPSAEGDAYGYIHVGYAQPWYVREGSWTNGCGGKGCDDSAYGETRYGSFHVTELKTTSQSGVCLLWCEGFGYEQYGYGLVQPGAEQAWFDCAADPGGRNIMMGKLTAETRASIITGPLVDGA